VRLIYAALTKDERKIMTMLAVGCYSMKNRSSTGTGAYDFCPPCIQNYVRVERARRSVSGADAGCTEAV
jgi:hypothetical protein